MTTLTIVQNPMTEQVTDLTRMIANGRIPLTPDLRAAIARLNAACAKVHSGKDPRTTPPRKEHA